MSEQIDDVRFCARVVKEAVETYKLYDAFPDNFPRSVDSLVRAGYTKYRNEFKIQYPKEPVPHGVVLGYYLWQMNKHTVHIYVDKGQNTCWRRFIQCKEIFQFLLDKESHRVQDVKQHLIDMGPQPPLPSVYKPKVGSETIAVLGAMEFLFPYAERKPLAGSTQYRAIAEKYMVPEKMVSDFLTEPFMDVLREYFE